MRERRQKGSHGRFAPVGRTGDSHPMLSRLQLASVGLVLSLASSASAEETTTPAPLTTSDVVASAAATEQAPPTWYTPSARNKHPWLTTIELGTTILGGLSWYWIDRERQVADWDYPGWESKLLFEEEIFIFDNNPFEVNYSWHTFAGGASHVLGRSNGMGVYESAAFGLGASLVWEYGIESRELISLNDILVTNTTGVAVGEFFHRLGQYAHSPNHEGPAWSALQWTLGLAHGVHAQWDKNLDEQPNLWPRFRFSYGMSTAGVSRQDGADAEEQTERHLLHNVAFDGSIVALENYMQPGSRSGFFKQANFTSFQLKLTTGDGSATHAYGDTVLAGWRSEDIPDEGDQDVGLAYNVGTSIGYRYHREGFGAWEDRLGGLHLPGLATDGQVLGEKWQLRWSGRAHLDLMGVNALSSQRWNDAHLDEDTGEVGKSILKNQGYYYGWGASTRASVELQVPIVTVGGGAFYGRYYSIEGYDRIRNELAYEVRGNDSFLDLEGWLRAKLMGRLYAEIRFGDHRRDGQLGEFFAEESMQRWSLEVGGAL